MGPSLRGYGLRHISWGSLHHNPRVSGGATRARLADFRGCDSLAWSISWRRLRGGLCRLLRGHVLRSFGRRGRLGRRPVVTQAGDLGELLEPAFGQGVGLRVVVDVDVESVHDVEARIAEKRLQGLALDPFVDLAR